MVVATVRQKSGSGVRSARAVARHGHVFPTSSGLPGTEVGHCRRKLLSGPHPGAFAAAAANVFGWILIRCSQ